MGTLNIEVVSATQDLIAGLKGKLREADNEECMASSGITADEAMQAGFDHSPYCWIGKIDGEPFCAFGVIPYPLLRIRGVPWMLGTDKVKTAIRGIAKYSKEYILEMLEPFEILENYVDARNIVSINWLKRCGFKVEAAEPFGLEQMPFHRFWMKKELFYV